MAAPLVPRLPLGGLLGTIARQDSATSSRQGSITARSTAADHDGGKAKESVAVCLHIRRLLAKETQEGCTELLTVQPGAQQVSVGMSLHQNQFAFDRVYGTAENARSPADLYDDYVAPCVEGLMSGINACVLAYGQTGAGKSFTMGTDLQHAESVLRPSQQLRSWMPLGQRVIDAVVDKVEALRATGADVQLSCSFMEIYQDKIRDLLAPAAPAVVQHMVPSTLGSTVHRSGTWQQPGPRQVLLRDPDPKKEVILVGLEEVQVNSTEELHHCLLDGVRLRVTAATNANLHSSRSHAIFVIRVRQVHKVTAHAAGTVATPRSPRPSTPSTPFGGPGSRSRRSSAVHPMDALHAHTGEEPATVEEIIESKIYLVDLAGSERIARTGAVGERLTEACTINQALLALGNVIDALCDAKRVHVPYRDHVLTRILRNALGGNSRTLMVACVSPTDMDAPETLNTMRYASRARNIKNMPVVNAKRTGPSSEEAMMLVLGLRAENDALRAEADALRAELDEAQTAAASESSTAAELQAARAEAQAARTEVDVLREEAESLREELTLERTRAAAAEDQVASLVKKLREALEETELLSAQLAQVKELAQAQLTVAAEEVAGVGSVADVRQAVDVLVALEQCRSSQHFAGASPVSSTLLQHQGSGPPAPMVMRTLTPAQLSPHMDPVAPVDSESVAKWVLASSGRTVPPAPAPSQPLETVHEAAEGAAAVIAAVASAAVGGAEPSLLQSKSAHLSDPFEQAPPSSDAQGTKPAQAPSGAGPIGQPSGPLDYPLQLAAATPAQPSSLGGRVGSSDQDSAALALLMQAGTTSVRGGSQADTESGAVKLDSLMLGSEVLAATRLIGQQAAAPSSKQAADERLSGRPSYSSAGLRVGGTVRLSSDKQLQRAMSSQMAMVLAAGRGALMSAAQVRLDSQLSSGLGALSSDALVQALQCPGPLRQLVRSLRRQHDHAVLARKRRHAHDARAKLTALAGSVLSATTADASSPNGPGKRLSSDGQSPTAPSLQSLEAQLEKWIRLKTQDCELDVMLDAEREQRRHLVEQLAELDTMLTTTSSSVGGPGSKVVCPPSPIVDAEAREAGDDTGGTPLAAQRASLTARLEAQTSKIRGLVEMRAACHEEADALQKKCIAAALEAASASASKQEGAASVQLHALDAEQQAGDGHAASAATTAAAAMEVMAVAMQAMGRNGTSGLSASDAALAMMWLIVMAINLRRAQYDMLLKVEGLAEEVRWKEQLAQLYDAEVCNQASKLEALQVQSDALHAQNTKLEVLAAQRQEAVSLLVAARMAQADAEARCKFTGDELEDARAELEDAHAELAVVHAKHATLARVLGITDEDEPPQQPAVQRSGGSGRAAVSASHMSVGAKSNLGEAGGSGGLWRGAQKKREDEFKAAGPTNVASDGAGGEAAASTGAAGSTAPGKASSWGARVRRLSMPFSFGRYYLDEQRSNSPAKQ